MHIIIITTFSHLIIIFIMFLLLILYFYSFYIYTVKIILSKLIYAYIDECKCQTFHYTKWYDYNCHGGLMDKINNLTTHISY